MHSSGSSLAPSTCRFGPLDIEYDDRVLTPRPWTYVQSKWAVQLLRDAPPGPLLELCAGAGQIGLAAAVELGRDLVQVESEPVAAAFAERNAARAGWSEHVDVRVARLERAVHPGERFPLVLADPPYLPTADTARWPDDPPAAVDGGPDGLAVSRICLAVAATCLPTDGWLLLQVAGPAQARQVTELAVAAFAAEGLHVVDEQRAVQLLRRR
jgi:release factor glutamine methyltransferase